MAKTCVFCGGGGKLTREHIFGDWLTRLGLAPSLTTCGAGPINRSPRDLGVTRPFTRKVRDVCGPCNHGWMSNLEAVAGRVLTPFILGNPGSIAEGDAGAIAAWAHKTALVALLVSSDDDRARGYGVSAEEYRALHAVQEYVEPLPDSQFWIGCYNGEQRLASAWVTPMIAKVDGLPEPGLPQAYVMTVVLGKLLLHGLRFTTPGLQFNCSSADGFAQVWPKTGPVSWPYGTPIDDSKFPRLAKGFNLVSRLSHVTLVPWRPATELSPSTAEGLLVRLPTPCGKHSVFYPKSLAIAGLGGDFCAFTTTCECGKSYLVQTEEDGAHFKAEGSGQAVDDAYARLAGEEFVIRDDAGQFVFKELATGAVSIPAGTAIWCVPSRAQQ